MSEETAAEVRVAAWGLMPWGERGDVTGTVNDVLMVKVLRERTPALGRGAVGVRD